MPQKVLRKKEQDHFLAQKIGKIILYYNFLTNYLLFL